MKNLKAFFAIHKKLKEQGDERNRYEVVFDFTNGRKQSLSELSDHEFRELCQHMSRLVTAVRPEAQGSEFERANKMRRKLIAILTKVGYTKDNKADMERINNWCETHGYLHKSINDYEYKELPKLIAQAENMYWKFLKKI